MQRVKRRQLDEERIVRRTREEKVKRRERSEEKPRGSDGDKPPVRRQRSAPQAVKHAASSREAHSVERAKRDGWVYLKVGKLDSTLRWRIQSKGGIGAKEFRWYFVGSVQVCAMRVSVPGMPWGNYVVFINSRAGNAGIGFKTEDEAHNFIIAELTRSPRDVPFEVTYSKERMVK